MKYIFLKLIGIILLKYIGAIFSLFGLLGVFASVVAIIDPVGTQLANDSDPFGVPPTQTESLQILAGYFFLLSLGVWILFHRGRRDEKQNTKL